MAVGLAQREPWLQTVAEVFKDFLQKRKAELFRRMGMTNFLAGTCRNRSSNWFTMRS